ncbi:MAG: tetratricopeptide repeat protein [Myxococcales bacterium]|nr:MAG: tetratricopeptide repeat protein [Myxococcales bacterium]
MFLLFLLGSLACRTVAAPPDVLDPLEAEQIAHLKERMTAEARELAVELMELGEKSFAQGDLEPAYQAWSRAARLSPDWDLPLLQLALIHPLYDNNREAAIEALEKAVAINPVNPRARFLLGVARHQAGLYEGAEASLKESVRLKPDYVEAHLRLATLNRERGRTAEALTQYEWLGARQPGNVLVISILAALYEETGALDKAEQALKRLIDLQNNPAYAYYKLGLFYERVGRKPDAEAAYRRAEALKPGGQKRRMRPLLPSKR